MTAPSDPLECGAYLTDGVSLWQVMDVNERTWKVFLEDAMLPDVLVEFSVDELLSLGLRVVRQPSWAIVEPVPEAAPI